MDNETDNLESPKSRGKKLKIKPGGIIALAVGLLVIIGGVIYLTWPSGTPGEDLPPTLTVPEDGKMQGLIKLQGQNLDAEDDLNFFEFKQAHVAAWDDDVEDDLQASWGDPVDVPVSLHYYYLDENYLSVTDLVGVHITNATESNYAGDDNVNGLIEPKMAEDVASEYDEGVVFAMWSPGEDDYERGWHIFPEGPFDPAASSEINVIEDPDDFIIPAYRGFLLWPSIETKAYGVKDESMFATSFPKPLENNESGWVMVATTDDPENVLGLYAQRIEKIYVLTGTNTFEEASDIDDALLSQSPIVWLKLSEKESVS
ncbi:hypothetical protein ACFL21_04875 [Patescibacteria group bacterium]